MADDKNLPKKQKSYTDSLREKQFIFTLNLSKLLAYLYSIGFTASLGEVYRTPERQLEVYKQGLSKITYGQHQKRLAVDINLFRNGHLMTEREAFQLISDYWLSLHPDNDCGYNWNWDYGHFEMKG